MRYKGFILTLLFIMIILILLVLITILSLGAYVAYNMIFRQINDSDIVGTWVYKIILPEEETGLKDIKESKIEFFDDKTFKMTDVPAVTLQEPGPNPLSNWGGKGEVVNGSGTWEISKGSEGQDEIDLHFKEMRGKSFPTSINIFIYRWPWRKISLYYEASQHQSSLCMFNKVK